MWPHKSARRRFTQSVSRIVELLEPLTMLSFTVLHREGAIGVSSDGSTVIGNGPENFNSGWAWDADDEFNLSNYFGTAVDVSADGQYIFGLGPNGAAGGSDPDIFDRDYVHTDYYPGGSSTQYGNHDLFVDGHYDWPYYQAFNAGGVSYSQFHNNYGAMSDDGGTIIASGVFYRSDLGHYPSFGDYHYFTLIRSDDVNWKIIGPDWFLGSQLSADGRVLGGMYLLNSHDFEFVTTSGQTTVVPGGNQADIHDLSPDGNYIAGYVADSFSSPAQAVLVSRAGSLEYLGVLPGYVNSEANAVSADGKVTVGRSWKFNTSTHENEEAAFRWTEEDGLQNLQTYLEDQGEDLEGLTITSATGISANGRTIVGTALTGAGIEVSWVWHGTHVVNVLTHGFGNGVFPGFLDPWYQLDETIKDIPDPGSTFAEPGTLDNYVANWNSSSGWMLAFMSYATSGLFAGTGNPIGAGLAFAAGKAWMRVAKVQAEHAADKIVLDITDPAKGILGDPSLSVSGGEVINLIGHSRGAAVNARVAKLLSEQGYVIDQYTALDGYSTDWPALSGLLGDISIVDEVNASNVNNKINFEVEQGLLQVASSALDNIFVYAAAPLLPATLALMAELLPGWKAPDRLGFVNVAIDDPVNITNLSNHLNIVDFFTNSGTEDVPSIYRYLWASYLGRHQADGTGQTAPEVPPYGGGETSPPPVEISGPAVPRGADDEPDPGQFLDGTFEDIASILADLDGLDVSAFNDPGLDTWKSLVLDPESWLQAEWNPVGDVTLATTATNTALRISSSVTSSISQDISFNDQADGILLDLTTITYQADAALEIRIDDRVIDTIPLTNDSVTRTLYVALPKSRPSVGTVSLTLTGSSESPAQIELDNIGMHKQPELLGVQDLHGYLMADPSPLVVTNLILDAAEIDLSGGVLSINFLEGTSTGDSLTVLPGTTSSGSLSILDQQILVDDTLVGTMVSGTTTQPLTINFVDGSTPAQANAVISRISLVSTSYSTPHQIQIDFTSGLGVAAESAKTYLLVDTPPQLKFFSNTVGYAGQTGGVTVQPSTTIDYSTTSSFQGGTISVTISGNANPSDKLTIGNFLLRVTTSGNKILIDGLQVATYQGGTGSTPLVITFGPDATIDDATAVLQSIRFAGPFKKFKKLPRTLDVTVTDSFGAVSDTYQVKVVKGKR